MNGKARKKPLQKYYKIQKSRMIREIAISGLARQTKDGVKTHRRKENESAIPLNELVIFDSKYKEEKGQPVAPETLVPMMSQQFFGSMTQSSTESTPPSTFDSSSETSVKETTTTSRPTSLGSSTTEPVTEFTTKATTTTTEYDPANFYHTPRPKPPKKEKVLTFCTKDIAIRDERNMVVACGGELDVWVPNRCPVGTDCFVSSDSTYRICCPISKG